MNKDDQIYLLLLLVAIPIGLIFKRFKFESAKKEVISTCIGLIIVLIVCSYDIIHSLIVVVVNATILTTIHPK